jgi:hypothetical protein
LNDDCGSFSLLYPFVENLDTEENTFVRFDEDDDNCKSTDPSFVWSLTMGHGDNRAFTSGLQNGKMQVPCLSNDSVE